MSTSVFFRGIISFPPPTAPGFGLAVLDEGPGLRREMIGEIMSDGFGAGREEDDGGEVEDGCGCSLGFEMGWKDVDGCGLDTGRELAWGGRDEAAGLLERGRDAGLLERAGGGDEEAAWDCGREEEAGRSSNRS